MKIDETDSPSGGRTQTDGFASYRTPLHSGFIYKANCVHEHRSNNKLEIFIFE